MKISQLTQAPTRALNVVPVTLTPRKIDQFRGSQFKMAYYATKFNGGEDGFKRMVGR